LTRLRKDTPPKATCEKGKHRAPALYLLPFCPVHAGPKIYQTGKLVSVQSPETDLPFPLPSGQTWTLPTHRIYELEVHQADLVYIGYCPKRDYKGEWRAGDDVQLRTKKGKLFLKRSNGKEFVLDLQREAKIGPDGKAVTFLSYKKH